MPTLSCPRSRLSFVISDPWGLWWYTRHSYYTTLSPIQNGPEWKPRCWFVFSLCGCNSYKKNKMLPPKNQLPSQDLVLPSPVLTRCCPSPRRLPRPVGWTPSLMGKLRMEQKKRSIKASKVRFKSAVHTCGQQRAANTLKPGPWGTVAMGSALEKPCLLSFLLLLITVGNTS